MAELPVTIDDVRRAAGVIHGHVRRTPVFSCASLGEGVWLKAELLQRTGAFKVRGAFSRIAELTPEERARGVVTCSAGNHAAGVALAGRELGTDALVMMPSSRARPRWTRRGPTAGRPTSSRPTPRRRSRACTPRRGDAAA